MIADYKDFLERAAPRPRAYAAMDHDAAVWLSLRRLRTLGVSALDSGALFLTNDYWFHRWDKSTKVHNASPGAIVLPTQLLQTLRPFVPATDDFSRRFGETFALPEFRTAQTGYKTTAAKVLSFLAVYRDLPEETALALLKDYQLHARLRNISDESPEFQQAIELEIVRLNQILLEEKVAIEGQVVEERATVNQLTEERTLAVQAARTEKGRAEAAEDALRRLRLAIRVGAAVALFIAGVVLLAFGPDFVRIPWPPGHIHRQGLTLAAVVAIGGTCLAMAAPNRRNEFLFAAVIGGVLVIAQIL